MTEKQRIDRIISSRHIAVAGVSRNPKKFGNIVYDHLKKNGYHVYALNPNMQSINGDVCYPDIASLPQEVQSVVMVTKPEVTLKLLKEAAAKGIYDIWMQQGAESPEAMVVVKELNLSAVDKRCIMMFVEPVKSVHSFHRFLMKLFGKYPK